MRLIIRFGLIPILFSSILLNAEAGKIKKCKDDQGRWHYGDTAGKYCDQSEIIELTDKGTKTRVIKAPATADELAERERNKEEEERKKKAAADQARRDEILLTTYGHENDIVYIKKRKIEQLESSIQASLETLKSLEATLERLEKQAAHEQRGGKSASPDTIKNIDNNKAQIARHEAAIQAKRDEQQALGKRYDGELERYREIKRRQASQAVK